MNDRFRFRAFDINAQKYLEDFLIQPEAGIVVYSGAQNEDNVIIEQCTGLKDKNGTLIFEGDIIKREVDLGRRYIKKEDIDVVKWSINGFMLENYFDYFADTDDFEVIGNIHENRELLRRKTND